MVGWRVLRSLLFRLPPERSHELALGALARVQGTPIEDRLAARYRVDDDRLAVEAFGLDFDTPLGLAAGFDKNARAPNALAALGFGHVEVGAVTADGQAGNPRPRLFRLPEDRALINRMGFNNDGAEAVGERLRSLERRRAPIGVNLGKGREVDLADAPADYRRAFEAVADVGDYVVVNVSSPNTPGLRDLQAAEALRPILAELRDAGAAPLLVKLSPDLESDAVDELLAAARTFDVEGFIAVNTTRARPSALSSAHRRERGGLSGEPLRDRTVEAVAHLASRTDRPIVGVGGIDGPEAAYRLLTHGADVLQVYTGFVYGGPGFARRVNEGLRARLERDGFADVAAAVGSALE
ncbi:MAG: quinone-dependent dihydroorotate dehydrogenase [Halobacteriales archaeon]